MKIQLDSLVGKQVAIKDRNFVVRGTLESAQPFTERYEVKFGIGHAEVARTSFTVDQVREIVNDENITIYLLGIKDLESLFASNEESLMQVCHCDTEIDRETGADPSESHYKVVNFYGEHIWGEKECVYCRMRRLFKAFSVLG